MYKLFLTEKQLSELVSLAQPNPSAHLMILLGINTLFRVTDLVTFKRSDLVNSDGTPAMTTVRKTIKTQKVMTINLRNDTRAAIARREAIRRDSSPWVFPSPYNNSRHINRHTAERWLQDYLRKMRIETCMIRGNGFHVLRRSMGAIIRKRKSLEAAQAALAHLRLSSTVYYIDIAEQQNAATEIILGLKLDG